MLSGVMLFDFSIVLYLITSLKFPPHKRYNVQKSVLLMTFTEFSELRVIDTFLEVVIGIYLVWWVTIDIRDSTVNALCITNKCYGICCQIANTSHGNHINFGFRHDSMNSLKFCQILSGIPLLCLNHMYSKISSVKMASISIGVFVI